MPILLMALKLFLIPVPAMADARSEIYLAPQESEKIAVAPGQAIHVKGKKIIQIVDLGPQIKITGLSEGQASLNIGPQVIQVYVVSKKYKDFFKSLSEKLNDFLGLKAFLQDGRITLAGTLYRLSDWQDIMQLAEEHSETYNFKAQIPLDILPAVKEWVLAKIKEKSLPVPHFVWAPTVRATLPEEYLPQSAQWAEALAQLGIEYKFEKSLLAVAPLVRVRIVVAEINKKMQSQIGIEWPNMVSAQISPTFSSSNKLEIFLKAMELNGLGQILASPNLLARSGSEADFLAGGEFPIKIITPKMHDVTWKRHGIYLKIKPQADLTGHLSIELSTEVSLLDPASAVDGIPGLKTNRMSTHFDLSNSRTIVLSGLIRNDWGQSQQGLAGLSRIPILGGLFRSQDFADNRSELVIFVTPEIVNTNTESPAALPAGWISHE